MAKNTKAADAVETSAQNESNAGLRARRALMMKQFVPSPDWIMQNVVAKGKGTKVTVGRVIGIAHSVRRHVNDINGRQVESIALGGIFEGETSEGEVLAASTVYFPMAYAEMVAAALDQDGVKVVQVDADIGLEATGKTIPYEWTVTSYVEGEAMAVLSALRKRRGLGKRPTSLLPPKADKPKEIESPATIEGDAAAAD